MHTVALNHSLVSCTPVLTQHIHNWDILRNCCRDQLNTLWGTHILGLLRLGEAFEEFFSLSA